MFPFPALLSQYKDKFSSVFIKEDLETGIREKDPAWYQKRGEWLLGGFMQNQGSIRYTDIQNYEESRLYGQGKQPNAKYMDLLSPRKLKNGEWHGKRKSWMNISWDIFPAYVRIRNKVLGYMLNFEYYINASCDDEFSDADRNEIKLKLILKQQHGEFMQFMEQALGQSEQNPDLPFVPKSMQEIEMIDQMGGFKLWQELAMEMFCKRSFDLSDWEEISKRLKEDIIDLGLCITKDYLDPFTFRPKVRYCDPQWTGISHSVNPSSSDISEAFEIKFYTAGDLLRKYPQISKEDMLQAIKANKMDWGNALYSFNNFSQWSNNMNWAKIAVMEFEFLSINKEKYKGVKKVAPTYNGKDTTTTYDPTWYEACWIIGTDIVYGYGKRQNAPYSWNSEKCNSSYTMYRAGERSMTDICKATIDELQINVYKTRNAEIKARPSGIAVDWSALLGMTHGGEKLSPFDMLKINQDTGNILYKGRTMSNGTPVQGASSPVTELKGGIGGYLTELMTLNMKYMNDLRDLTGFPALIDATNSASPQGLGVTEIAQSAAADVLRPSLFAYRNVKKRATENICMRWQMLALLHPEIIKDFSREVGTVWASILTTGSEMAFYRYSIGFEAAASPQTVQDIKQAALMSLQAAKTGAVGISMTDYMFILRQLERGNLKYAEVYLSWREQVRAEEQAQLQRENMELNGKNATEAEKQKSTSEAQKLQAEMMKALAIEDEKTKGSLALQDKKAKDDLALQKQKYEFELEMQSREPKPVAAK